MGWISVKDRLPEVEKKVLICADRKGRRIITTGMYEDGTVTEDDSVWNWVDLPLVHDEETDTYLIPMGWWEDKEYNQDDEYNHPIDDVVTHWMELPTLPNREE